MMNRNISRRWLPLLAVMVGSAMAFTGCGQKPTANWPSAPGLRVAVSFPPYYSFCANVLGDAGHVKSLLTTQGPHHSETNIQERIILEEANLFVINGVDLDDALADSLAGSTSNKKLKIVSIGSQMNEGIFLEASEGCSHCNHKAVGKEGQKGGHSHDHPHDPHIWTSPRVAKEIIQKIRASLSEADPANATKFEANATAYISKLDQLIADGNKLLKGKSNRSIVTMHNSLTYFANEFNIEITGVIQKSPGKGPSNNELKDLIAKCIKEKTRVIAVEPQYPSRTAAKTLQDELIKAGLTDVEIIELDPLETCNPAELNAGWYEAKLRANLEALAKALK